MISPSSGTTSSSRSTFTRTDRSHRYGVEEGPSRRFLRVTSAFTSTRLTKICSSYPSYMQVSRPDHEKWSDSSTYYRSLLATYRASCCCGVSSQDISAKAHPIIVSVIRFYYYTVNDENGGCMGSPWQLLVENTRQGRYMVKWRRRHELTCRSHGS